jgi:anti-sigma factor RsiW
MGGDVTASGNDSASKGGGACDLLAERLSDVLAGDLPVAMKRELELHQRSCARCSAEVESAVRLVTALRAAPAPVRRDAVWSSIEAALAREPARHPLAFALEAVLLGVLGVALASTLALRNDRVVAWVEANVPGFVRESLLAGSLRACLLPTLFALFGAIVAVVALPLLAARRPPLPVLALAARGEKVS